MFKKSVTTNEMLNYFSATYNRLIYKTGLLCLWQCLLIVAANDRGEEHPAQAWLIEASVLTAG